MQCPGQAGCRTLGKTEGGKAFTGQLGELALCQGLRERFSHMITDTGVITPFTDETPDSKAQRGQWTSWSPAELDAKPLSSQEALVQLGFIWPLRHVGAAQVPRRARRGRAQLRGAGDRLQAGATHLLHSIPAPLGLAPCKSALLQYKLNK